MVCLQPFVFINAAIISGLEHRAFSVFKVGLFHALSNSSHLQSGGVWAVITVSRGWEGAPGVPVTFVMSCWQRGPPDSFTGPHSFSDM